jgi:NAD(P)-dependent dehydrogenase (short-subunit alcohol dehydrogenase family)
MSKLNNKVAVITGGNSGIGYATGQELVRQNARVVITGRKKELVDEAAKNLGNGTIGLVADQSDLAALDKLVEQVKDTFGSVDILFINAGVAAFAPIGEISEDHFDYHMNINFKGAFFTLQKFLLLLSSLQLWRLQVCPTQRYMRQPKQR